MKEKDFIYVEFTGRTKDTDEVFDTTYEEMAKLAGIHNPKINYGPIPIIIGAKQIIPGLEESLKEMEIGEKRKIEINSEKAFGERNPDLLKLLPMSVFKDNNIQPTIGRVVNFNEISGRVVSVDGGRVKVDFNHPLAGKTIEYDIEIKSEIKDEAEKVKSVVKYFTGIKYEDEDVTIDKNETTIVIQKFDLPKQVKQNIAGTIMKWVDGINKVVFKDVFEAN